ncbi:MAG TPA: multiheme c-type cytochrome, partial [Candidatus Hypogeohydataceae bacterium YC40]
QRHNPPQSPFIKGGNRGIINICIIFSGEERGYLEPCGCAKPSLGGIAKRHTFLKSLPEPRVAVSLGDLAGHDGTTTGILRQKELQAETLAQALKIMNYSIHNLGERDLEMGLDVLAYLFPPGAVPLLYSNIKLASPFIEVVPYKILEVRATLAVAQDNEAGANLMEKNRTGESPAPTLKIGFLGILSPTLLGPPPTGVEITPPAEALPPLIKELKDKVDVLILLSHASMEESLRLARDFPEFHIVASGHGIDHPITVKEGNTWVVNPGNKGKHLVLYRYNPPLSPFDKNTSPISPFYKGGERGINGTGVVETVTLDERFNDSDTMLNLLDNYQQRLKDENLLWQVEKLPLPEQTSYVGSSACKACHPAVFQHWGSTLHAMAYETLLKVGRAFDPECVACHVVGLNYSTGFQSREKSPDLIGVGCEACHGPGSLHIGSIHMDRPSGLSSTQIPSPSMGEGRERVKETDRSKDLSLQKDGYGKVYPEDCHGCHDPEHSPPFKFESCWERIKHPVETPIYPNAIK